LLNILVGGFSRRLRSHSVVRVNASGGKILRENSVGMVADGSTACEAWTAVRAHASTFFFNNVDIRIRVRCFALSHQESGNSGDR